MPKTVDFKTDERLTTGIALHVAQLDDLLRRQKHFFHDMTTEELDWRPAANLNSSGTLLLHIATVEVSWIREEVLGGGFPVDHDAMRAHREGMSSKGLPQISGRPIEFYLESLDIARASTKDGLQRFSDADLTRTFRDAGNSDTEFTLRWILYHLVEHAAYHEGQIGYLRRLRTMTRPAPPT